MEKPDYFKAWINGSEAGVRICLCLILICSLMQFGAFALTQNYVIASFGAQPEDVTLALQITYVAIVPFIAIQFRLFQYFEIRSYLLTGIIACIVINVLSLQAKDIVTFTILRFLNGLSLSLMSGPMLILIFSRIDPERVQVIGLSILYGAILGNGVVIGFGAALIDTTLDWTVIYYFLIAFLFLCLLLTLVLLRPATGRAPMPLDHLDWPGGIFLAAALIAFSYTMIYGPKYYWFSDTRIRSSALAAVIFFAFFIYREFRAKIPVVDLSVFRYRSFISGLLLLIAYYGLKDSINLVYNYTGTILQWSGARQMELGFFNLAGLLSFMWLSAEMMITKKHSTRRFLIAGFGMLLVYHLYVYLELTPDLAFEDLVLPMFLHGAASGMLFVPIIIYTLSSVPPTTGTTGIVVGALMRFTATLNSIAGLYTLQLHYNQHYKESFLNYLTANDPAFVERLNSAAQFFNLKTPAAEQGSALAMSGIVRTLGAQQQLLTLRTIFLLFSAIILCIILTVLFITSAYKTNLYLNNLRISGERQ